MKSKKAGEKYLSLWWFFCLAVIAGGMIVGVSIFATSDVSTKEAESGILVSRVVNCFISGEGEKFPKTFDVFEDCYLDKEIIDKEKGDYYLFYEVYNFDDCEQDEGFKCENPVIDREFGDKGIGEQCSIVERINAERYPECSEVWIKILNGKKRVLHVKAGSNQVIKRVEWR